VREALPSCNCDCLDRGRVAITPAHKGIKTVPLLWFRECAWASRSRPTTGRRKTNLS